MIQVLTALLQGQTIAIGMITKLILSENEE
jgi:hypothetical protein